MRQCDNFVERPSRDAELKRRVLIRDKIVYFPEKRLRTPRVPGFFHLQGNMPQRQAPRAEHVAVSDQMATHRPGLSKCRSERREPGR